MFAVFSVFIRIQVRALIGPPSSPMLCLLLKNILRAPQLQILLSGGWCSRNPALLGAEAPQHLLHRHWSLKLKWSCAISMGPQGLVAPGHTVQWLPPACRTPGVGAPACRTSGVGAPHSCSLAVGGVTRALTHQNPPIHTLGHLRAP